MSLYKKSDVKNHFSPRHLKGMHLDRPTSRPETTGLPEAGNPDEEPGHVVDAPETAATEGESGLSNVEVLAASRRT